MKKCIILTMLLCASVFTFGQEPSSLHVQKMDGTTQTALLVTIEKITFEEDVLVMTTTEGEFRLPLDDVEKITFGENDVSAVENVNTNSIHISKSGNLLSIKSDYAIKKLYVVDMSGRVLNGETLASVYEGTITLPNLGVFVLFMETSQGYIARKVINN
jgi:hypothetical protein